MFVIRAAFLSILLAVTASPATIRVGVAISLQEAMREVASRYEDATGERVELSFGSSGQIMAQIANGAELDLFVSAAVAQVDELEKKKLVDGKSRRDIVTNALVLIVPKDVRNAPGRFEDLAGKDVKKIAIGAPKLVPAGAYAQQVFEAMKLTDALAGKLVYGTNVRQVLAYVERSEVSAGVVYATDARVSGDKVRVVATADPKTHDPIVCPAVVVKASREPEAAGRFLRYLTQDEARTVFRAHGFLVPQAAKTQPADK
jgi:molybdate transport system substrate-binding protein